MLPQSYKREEIKDKENEAFLKGFEFAIKELGTVDSNLDADITLFNDPINVPLMDAMLNQYKSAVIEEAIEYLEITRDEIIVSTLDEEAAEGGENGTYL